VPKEECILEARILSPDRQPERAGPTNAEGDLPFASVIIPTYQRPAQLAECLDALHQQSYPSTRFEVIVVDDSGEPPAAPVVTAFGSRLRTTVVRVARGGPGAARNVGAANARGSILAFLDDDCRPDPRWLALLVGTVQQDDRVLVGSRIINALPSDLYASATHCLVDYLYRVCNQPGSHTEFLSSTGFAVSREAFLSIRGFDPSVRHASEDREFCQRWSRCGRRLVYNPEALVRHAHPLSAGQFWRQHFNYGRGAFEYRRTVARQIGADLRLERIAFYARLLGHPLEVETGPLRFALCGLLALSQLATAAGFVWQWQIDWRSPASRVAARETELDSGMAGKNRHGSSPP
jgi:cellulose synthase/poly-beta-1,6-N-acetylglucosamine synthase-like glycosyltransferase